MSHVLRFGSLVSYDPAQSGIELGVRVRCGSASADIVAKLDMGASHCVFRRAVAGALGVDVEAGTHLRIGTVTGGFEAYGHDATLTLLGVDLGFDAMVFFAADPAMPRNVLGRRGWIERVRIGLVDYEGRAYLSAYDDPVE